MVKDWIQEYRKVDKFKQSFVMDYKYNDIFKFYKNKYDCKVNESLYKNLCYDFNKLVNDAIIRKSFEFKLPFRLGSLRIRSRKQKILIKDGKLDLKRMAIDWAASHEMWKEQYPDLSYRERMELPNKKVIVHTNDHSNGYIMKWFWDKRLSNTKNQYVYFFRPVKGGIIGNDEYFYGKRGLAKWIKHDDRINEYFE